MRNVSQLLSQAKKITNGRGQVFYYIGYYKSIWYGHREDLIRIKCGKSATINWKDTVKHQFDNKH